MSINGAIYRCDGCGTVVSAADGFPHGWLKSDHYVLYITSCSADCVHAAKENVKRRLRERPVLDEKRVDAARMVRE